MKKKTQGLIVEFSESRHALLGFTLPFGVAVAANLYGCLTGILPLRVTGLMAAVGVALGLSSEKLTLDRAARRGTRQKNVCE
jgi:hypothetical protein